MTRGLRLRAVVMWRGAADLGWWVFVVGALIGGAIPWTGQTIFAIGWGQEIGATSFAPGAGYVDLTFTNTTQWWLNPGWYATVGLIVSVVSTAAVMLKTRAWARGALAIASMALGVALVMAATPDQLSVDVQAAFAVAVAVLAVALREAGIRWLTSAAKRAL